MFFFGCITYSSIVCCIIALTYPGVASFPYYPSFWHNCILSYSQRQRKKLAEKIEQLNSAIDNVSNQLQSDEPPNGAAVNVDDMEALI